ncbi:hypothetical protein SAMN05216316_0056 [Nitrosovibrio sp. Nv6]|nr:hypothetical protein SAMN05216316_0056 [Nitrosovibrio sp. Nv6]
MDFSRERAENNPGNAKIKAAPQGGFFVQCESDQLTPAETITLVGNTDPVYFTV